MHWFAPATDRVQAWREDLFFAETDFLARDRSFTPPARRAFCQSVRVLKEMAADLSDEELLIGLLRAVALSRNAHTRLYLLRNRTTLRRYPIRLYEFTEGLFVVRTTRSQSDLVGLRVTHLANEKLKEVLQRVRPLYAGNDPWSRYMSLYTLTCPEILQGLNLADDAGEVIVAGEKQGGRRIERKLKPLPLEKRMTRTEAWWSLSPAYRRSDEPSPAPTQLVGNDLPLFLREPTRHYWYADAALPDLLYLQFNRCENDPNGDSFQRFGNKFLEILDRQAPRKLVIDLRFNTGGNLAIANSWVRDLAKRKLTQDPNRFFVVTGQATFSAGLYHAAQLQQLTGATFVGEPPGDELDYWAEGGNVILPHSELALHYVDGFHCYSTKEYVDCQPYHMQLSLPSFRLDKPIQLTWEDYRNGRDSVMEWIRMLP